MKNRCTWFALTALALCSRELPAQTILSSQINTRAAAVEKRVVAWRRDIHEHPELGNSEVRTAKLVADHLRGLGMEVRTGVAHTGVIGVLKGGRPGPVVALRADMDALPVTEQVNVPFASTARGTYLGQDVGVMHACGHDTHVAMLMGAAEVLAGMRAQLQGTVLFIFQPAEEGVPPGEEGGAKMMLEEGAFSSPKPDAIFGIHIFGGIPAGDAVYRVGGMLASADQMRIVVSGRQTHGARPWGGIDPIVIGSQIVLGLQTIVSRQVDLATAAAVVTVGMFQGGVRNNIIPDSVVLVGTIRALDQSMREDVHARVKRTAEGIAASAGATVAVTITDGTPVTVNNAALTQWAAPVLERVIGKGRAYVGPANMVSEDFSYFANTVPGFYFLLGATPRDTDMKSAASNHSPLFFVDESALPVGVRALAELATSFLASGPAAR
ncbi:MAG: amidohydrolase [Longimicrobiales bacterium]